MLVFTATLPSNANINIRSVLLVVLSTLIHFIILHSRTRPHTTSDKTQDITTSRPNTLYDNADDIQRQLDNEARDRMKFGRPKTVWVFHFPTHLPEVTTVGLQRYYRGIVSLNILRPPPPQDMAELCQNTWHKTFPDCGGRSQSPVNLPNQALIKAKGGRRLVFINYDVQPKSLTLTNDGKRVILTGEWELGRQPLVTGGAAHSRRYLFHSITYHWPSEHSISGLLYPMETQVLHISADYKSFDEAVRESKHDLLAFLGIVNIYTFSNRTQSGVLDILKAAASGKFHEESVPVSPLNHFNPPFKAHVSYQGSLTAPPCTESVLWIIRAKSLPIAREVVDLTKNLFMPKCDPNPLLSRQIQPLNDRKVYLFD
ncbi:hypothetical protein K1T71_005443 [Dendrolimus kikuchii]|uniref:Uncharacterized protein n=1 Tax=Dendrolimus kikuchii TaxID=765133 RepID=A0ACC1D447_9NEOP|nr:hypothetical protein K1T71_005443 [Dendrolimus kikuchii]